MRPAHRRTWSAAVGVASVALLAAVVPTTASAHDGPGVTITTVSNPRPDLVSGPDVLVRLTAPGSVVLRADGHSVEGLTRQADGSFLVLVRGLRPGAHHLVAESGRRQAAVTVIDHAASGPVFSGPSSSPSIARPLRSASPRPPARHVPHRPWSATSTGAPAAPSGH